MRWYGTRRVLAARLKYSTLRRERPSVTLTLSSRAASKSGDGRKSSITFTRPISPAVYLTVLLLIGSLSFPPVARAEDADHALAIREPDRHHAAVHQTEAEVAPLRATMVQVLGDDAVRIEK